MEPHTSRETSNGECIDGLGWPGADDDTSRRSAFGDGPPSADKDRLSRLVRAIEAEVIPRLVHAHRSGDVAAPRTPAPSVAPATPSAAPPDAADIDSLVAAIVADDATAGRHAVRCVLARGVTVESVYLDLLAPTARRLGELWSDDRCDFSTVTVALGRMQCMLRELSPAFGTEVADCVDGRRVLFAQPADEQHSFGLSMVAEFFRRDGWAVVGGVGGAVDDPAARARREWIDVVGFSIGSETRLEWLRIRIAAVRAASRNPDVVVLCGGPIFTLNPSWLAVVGADGTALDGRNAPVVAGRLLSAVARR